jgi:hypothetical protein
MITQSLPLDALCKFFDLQFMQHFIQDFLPDSFNNMWFLNAYSRNSEFHIALRNDDIIDVPFAGTSLTERQSLTRISKAWCDFTCEEIKIIRNKKTFNKDLKERFLLIDLKRLFPVTDSYVCSAIPQTDCNIPSTTF